MGCVLSKVDKEETVRRCRERKRLMKQLISCRADLAAAHLSYLRSLKNTGATLRQFTEVESLMIPGTGNSYPVGLQLPPSPPPPPPLPPSPPHRPPPLPQFSPQLTKPEIQEDEEEEEEEELDKNGGGEDAVDIDDYDNESCSSPPPVQGSAWEFWDPFGPPPPSNPSSNDEGADEEDWAEANAEFREEEENEGEGKNVPCANNAVLDLVKEEEKPLGKESVDDNSSAVSLLTKDTDMALVVWRTKKSLAGIVKEIDDYFLKAAAGGNEVVVLLESDQHHRLQLMEKIKGKSSKSAKVFSALSWNWSLKSPQSSKEGAYSQEERDVGRSTSHCTTLEKLYAKEQRLYKEVKEEELVKVLHRKKTLLLQKHEAREDDCRKTEEIRSDIENLHSQILSLQESINATCLSISKLRDEELHPQLAELIFGLMQMWRMMYECHQVQNHIAQQANLLDCHPGLEPTTDSHRFATAQLETEVTHWYNSFCNLLKSQRDYVQILNQWVGLTDCLPETSEVTGYAYGIRRLCEEWQLALNRLPDKVAAEAIKSFLSVIDSIFLQQKEEVSLQKKSHRLENRLEKELTSFSDLDKHEENAIRNLTSATKLEALKKRVEDEKTKYLNAIRNSRAMTLNNLQTGLPNVFQALMGFAGVCVQAFEGICQSSEATANGHLGSISPLCSVSHQLNTPIRYTGKF